MNSVEAVKYARTLGLGSYNRKRRVLAENAIRRMGAESITFLLAVIDGDKRYRTRRNRKIGYLQAVFCLAYLVSGFLLLHSSTIVQIGRISLMLPCVLLPMLVTVSSSRLQSHAIVMLADSCDVTHVPVMLNALGELTGKAEKTIRNSLRCLMPMIKPTDGHLIDEAMREKLLNKLDSSRTFSYYAPGEEADYVVAIIHCFETLGDERAYPIVKELAESLYLNGAGARIRGSAKSALPTLEQCAERNRISGALLRPSESPLQPDSLLRPAATNNRKEECLLAPSDAPLEGLRNR